MNDSRVDGARNEIYEQFQCGDAEVISMLTQKQIVALLLVRHILFRYPLTILYLWVFAIIIQYRKQHFNHPFYIILISLAISDFLFNITNEFYSIRYITVKLADESSWLYGPVSIYAWTPTAVTSPGLELFMSLMRFAAVAFPMKMKVRKGRIGGKYSKGGLAELRHPSNQRKLFSFK